MKPARLLRCALVVATSLSLAGVALPLTASIASAEGSSSADVVAQTPTSGWVPNNGVHALAQDAQWIYLGGTFTALTNPATHATFAASRLARISIATGDPDTTWTPSVNGDVRSLLMNATTGTLYVGGDYTTVDGSARTRLAAVSTSGVGALQSWYPGAANAVVNSMIQLDASTIMIGGGFTKIGTTTRAHLAKTNATTGAVVTTFVPKVDGSVYTINHPDGASFVYLGGLFKNLGGQSRGFLGAMDITTAAATAWNPGNPCPLSAIVCPVYGFVVTPTAVYAAVGGRNPRGSTISYDPTSGARNWTVTADGDNQAIALINGEIFVGGHFGPDYGNVTRDTLSAVNANNGTIEPWHPTVTNDYPGTAAMMVLPDGSLVVGGDQNTIGGTTDSKFAVFPPTANYVPDQAPVPVFTSNCSGDTCTFDASGSSDPDGSVAQYLWDFGDLGAGTGVGVGSGEFPTHQYGSTNTFTVMLTVIDDQGAAATTTAQVQATSTNQVPVAQFTSNCAGLTCTFDASASYDPDGTIQGYFWLYGDGSYAIVMGNTPTTAHHYDTAGTYTAVLFAYDNLFAPGLAVQVVSPTATAPPTQWITNGSFESGAAPGWTGLNANSTVSTVQPTGGSEDGSWALQVTNQATKPANVGILSSAPHWVTATVAKRVYNGSVFLSGPSGTKVTLKLSECPTTGTCAGSSSVVVTLPASGWIQANTSYTGKKNGYALRMQVAGTLKAKAALLTDGYSLISPS